MTTARQQPRVWDRSGGGIARLILLVLLISSVTGLADGSPKSAAAGASGGATSATKPKGAGNCVAQVGKLPPFARAGRVPARAHDLTYCQNYRTKTCCSQVQTDAIRRTLFLLGREGSEACRRSWSALECTACSPAHGVSTSPIPVCKSYCTKVFKACKDDFFSTHPRTQLLSPCGHDDTVCSALREWMKDGSEVCEAAGFREVLPEDGEECFDGREPVAIDEPKPKKKGAGAGGEDYRWTLALLGAAVVALGYRAYRGGRRGGGGEKGAWAREQEMMRARERQQAAYGKSY